MGYVVLWILVSFIALGVDIATTSFFFSGFTVGGILALIAQMLGADFYAQVIIFALTSAIAIWAEVHWVRKALKKTVPKTLLMEEQYIGRKLVSEDNIGERGKIKLEGIYWTVENEGEPIEMGEAFIITGIKGNKLIIKKQGE